MHWISGAWGVSLIYAGITVFPTTKWGIWRNSLPSRLSYRKEDSLFGHLVRMDETADARILTGVHQSDWSRPVGHPYSSWMATLKSDLSLHNLTFEDATELALDKSLWRLLVASGATHWHGTCRIMMMMNHKEWFNTVMWSTKPAQQSRKLPVPCLECL